MHLDVFNNDAFSLSELSLAMTSTPYQPMRIGELGWFNEIPIATLSVSIERVGHALKLVPSGQRGARGTVKHADKRSMLDVRAVHLPQSATIMADEIQGLRAFGKESDVETLQNYVNQRLAIMRQDIDVTKEWQRIGAIKGQVLDADGTSVMLDMFQLFGLTQSTKDMALDVDATKVRVKCVELKRQIEDALGGLMYRSIRVLCSASFFDALTGHPAVEAAFDRWMNGEFLRSDVRGGFEFGGIIWEEYRGNVAGVDFIEDGFAYAVPEGVMNLFRMHYAPAPYTDTVNTLGLPYYAKQWLNDNGTGVEIETQSNPLCLNTRPNTVVKLSV